MGHVYKAIDTSVKDKIALKVLPPDMAADRDALERFSREVQLARRTPTATCAGSSISARPTASTT